MFENSCTLIKRGGVSGWIDVFFAGGEGEVAGVAGVFVSDEVPFVDIDV